jgi:hypothetical protein
MRKFLLQILLCAAMFAPGVYTDPHAGSFIALTDTAITYTTPSGSTTYTMPHGMTIQQRRSQPNNEPETPIIDGINWLLKKGKLL